MSTNTIAHRAVERGRMAVRSMGRDGALAALRAALRAAPSTIAVTLWRGGVFATKGGTPERPNRAVERWEVPLTELRQRLAKYASRVVAKSTGWTISFSRVGATGGSKDEEAIARTGLFLDSDSGSPHEPITAILREAGCAFLLSTRGKKYHLDLPFAEELPLEPGEAAKLAYRERYAFLLGVLAELGAHDGYDTAPANRYAGQTFAYTRRTPLEPTPGVVAYDGPSALDWNAALGVFGFAPEARAQRVQRAPTSKKTRLVLSPEECVPRAEWERAAALIGGALGAIAGSWHEVSQALAGSIYERGIALEDGPAFLAMCVSASDDANTEGHGSHSIASVQNNARSTAKLLTNANDTRRALGFGFLRSNHPELAEAVDRALPKLGVARELRELLDARGVPDEITASEAVERIRALYRSPADGVSVLRVPEGTGKTRAVADEIIDRAATWRPPVSLATAMHKVATAVFDRAAQAGAPVAHRRGVLAVLQTDGTPACKRHAEASALASAGTNVPVSLCLGINAGADNGKDPCEFLSGCEAFAGVEREANTSDAVPAVGQVTVHALLAKAAEFAGDNLLVIDEAPAFAESCTLRAEDLRQAANVKGFFKGAAARVLRGVADALATAVPGAPIECTARALLEQCTNAEDRFLVVYRPPKKLATGEPIPGPPIPRSQWAPSLTPRARNAVRDASAVGEAVLRASTTLATLARLIAGSFPEELQSGQRAAGWVRVPYEETQGALVCVLGSNTLTTACARPGPTIFADATADVDVLSTLLGADNLSVVDLRVSDGAPVERTLLYCARATRKAWIPRDEPTRWEELAPYLNAAIEIANVPDGGSLGLITFQRLEQELQLAWDGSQYPHDGIARILRGLKERRVALVFGHYGALRGRDDWTHCDALITLGTPRANVGASLAIADALGIDHHAAYKHNVAAELSQACGRLRTPWRTKRGSLVVVGNVAPLGWDARAVVRELPKGRAPVAEAPVAEVPRPMTAEAFAAGLAQRGWSQAVAAQAFGVTQGTVSRWLNGRQPVALADNVGWPERVESTAAGMQLCTAAVIAPSKISEREQRPRPCIPAAGMRPIRFAPTSHEFEHERPLTPAIASEPARATVPRASALLGDTARALGWRSTADAVRALAPHIDGPGQHELPAWVRAWQRDELPLTPDMRAVLAWLRDQRSEPTEPAIAG